ncbi:MAG: hypothetical protein ACRDNM_03255 [Gaiellaceae bacterium]
MKAAFISCAAVAAAMVAASGAAAANSPVPVPGTASCQGHLIAISNHASGHGPGYYLGSSTHAEIVAYVESYCG